METIPWYKSAIIRQQVVQIIVAVLAFVGVTTDVDWSQTVEAIFAGIAACVAVWTIITRYIKPAPNMTLQAAVKEQELIDSGKIPLVSRMAADKRQRGYATSAQLMALFSAGVLVLSLIGCAGTVKTYREARDLPDTAYIVAEHYAALVKQAADIAENPATPESVREGLKAADRAVKPFILGDEEANRPGLDSLSESYRQVRDAKTAADLQNAINDAVRELTNFINAVKAARGNENATARLRVDRHAGRCAGLGITGAETNGGCLVRFG